MRSFAEKLGALLGMLSDDDGAPISGNQFLSDFNARSPVSMSRGYLSELLNGTVANPRLDLVEALAEYFQINPAYFVSSESDDVNIARVRLLGTMRKAGIVRLGARAEGLPAEALERISEVIESERVRAHLEGDSSPRDAAKETD